ncbi:MAG: hypothetical protein R6X25_12740 [Candidatus Krumholzibacteriia bacterium]
MTATGVAAQPVPDTTAPGTTAAGIVGDPEPYHEMERKQDPKELNFIGYYFLKGTYSNIAPTNEFLKGQVVGRLFGGNTTITSDATSSYAEQRFIPMFTYSPRLFDGWAKIRASFELDWTWGDAAYGTGGNFGGGYAADFVNVQTQNLFLELRPRRNLFINAGLQRLFDNVRVPWYTFTDHLTYKGYRLAFFGSDATGLSAHWLFDTDKRLTVGFYQLWENNVEQDDDVVLYKAEVEKDLSIDSSAGLSFRYVRDHASGEGGVSILGQGLNSGLSNYNGVFNFDFGNQTYTADVFWLGTQFHKDPLLSQGDTGFGGFLVWNFGEARTAVQSVDINGLAGNLRIAHRYGPWAEDQIVLDALYTTGDDDGIADGTYSGVLTGNNWSSPGAVFISHGLYLLLPHGNVVNRFVAAVMDIQNIGYGMQAVSLGLSKEMVPNKFRARLGGGVGYASQTVAGMGDLIGTELNLNLRWRMRVFMDLELHAAYLWLGDFYDSPEVNGSTTQNPLEGRPQDPWTVFTTFKWIAF